MNGRDPEVAPPPEKIAGFGGVEPPPPTKKFMPPNKVSKQFELLKLALSNQLANFHIDDVYYFFNQHQKIHEIGKEKSNKLKKYFDQK